MKARVFADSFYFIALINDQDRAHETALTLSDNLDASLIVTEWVLTEVADAFAATRVRTQAAKLIERLYSRSDVVIVPASSNLFRRGLELYLARRDKEWSLTDCISFVVMEDEGVSDALTGDKHFEQAGFNALLK
jgi:predicted nucleic acid-binding protein